MTDILKINQEQLGKRLGEIVPFDYVPKKGENEHVFVCYIFGDIPVKIKSTLTHEEFKKIC